MTTEQCPADYTAKPLPTCLDEIVNKIVFLHYLLAALAKQGAKLGFEEALINTRKMIMRCFCQQMGFIFSWVLVLVLNESPQHAQQLAMQSNSCLPQWTVQRELTTVAHSARITAVALSPDRKTIASAGGNRVTLSAVETGRGLQKLEGSTGMSFLALSYSPDGRWLVGGQSMLKEWNRSYEKGKPVITSRYWGEVLVWDARSGVRKTRLQARREPAWALAFSPDGRWLAVGTGPIPTDASCTAKCQGMGEVLLWDTQNWQLIHRLKGRTASIFSLAFAPDGQTLAGSSGMIEDLGAVEGKDRFEIFLWDVSSGQLKQVLPGHLSPITSIAYSPDGRWLASAGRDRKLNIWNCETYELERTISDYLVSYGELETLSGPARGKSAKQALPVTSWLNVLVFSQNGEQIIGGGGDGIIRVYQTDTGKITCFMRSRDWPIFSWAAKPDTNRLVFQQLGIKPWPPAYGVLNALTLSPDNKVLATGNADGKIRLLIFE